MWFSSERNRQLEHEVESGKEQTENYANRIDELAIKTNATTDYCQAISFENHQLKTKVNLHNTNSERFLIFWIWQKRFNFN